MIPKKHLGQNFLTQPKIAMDIVHAGNIATNDIILEVGPGKGILTEKLLNFSAKVVAIEKDKELVEFLRAKFSKEIASGKLELLEKDVRDFNPGVIGRHDLPYKVIANIPYYITGEIIRKFLEAKCQPEKMVLMVQKEVAERIVARNKKSIDSAQGKESILSISVKVYGKPKIVKKVSAGSFFPKPKVDSAILVLEDISKTFFTTNKLGEKEFFDFVKKGFKSPRKMLRGNLRIEKNEWKQASEKIKILENARPENLSTKNWLDLFKYFN